MPIPCRLGPGWDGLSGLEENGRRGRRRRRAVGAAVAARVSDERSEESARQDERQPDSRSPRLAARPVHDRAESKKAGFSPALKIWEKKNHLTA